MNTENHPDAVLIRSLGGPSEVARKIAGAKPVSPQRVQNWLTRGIPAQVKVDHPDLFLRHLSAPSAHNTDPASTGKQ